MSRGGVEVPIGANLGELRQKLGQATDLLADFQKGAHRARGSAIFFTQAIQGIGVASGQSASVVGLLVGGLAAGGPMGLAIAGVNALVGSFKTLNEQEKKTIEKNRELAESYRDVAQAHAEMRAEEAGGQVEEAKAKAEGAINKKREELNKKFNLASAYDTIAKYEALAQKVRDRIEQSKTLPEDHKGRAELIGRDEKILGLLAKDEPYVKAKADKGIADAELTKFAEIEQRKIIKAKEAQDKADKEAAEAAAKLAKEKAKAQKTAADQAASHQLDLESKLRTATAATAGEEAKARADSANKIAKLEEELRKEKTEKGRETIRKIIDQEQELLDAKLSMILLEKSRREGLDSGADAKKTDASNAAAMESTANQAQGEEADLKDRTKELEQLTAKWESNLSPLSQGFSDLFQGIADDSEDAGKTVARVFKGMALSYAQMLIQMLAKKIAANIAEKTLDNKTIGSNAAVAASGAAKSQAGIPYIGPILAMAAMAAMLAAVLALKSSRGGADLSAFDDGSLHVLHAKETVLPAPLAEGFRQIIAQGLVGQGGTISQTVNIAALDGESVYRVLVSNEREVMSALETIARNGH